MSVGTPEGLPFRDPKQAETAGAGLCMETFHQLSAIRGVDRRERHRQAEGECHAELCELEVGHIPPPEPKPPEVLPNIPPPVLLAPKGDEVLPKPIIDRAQRGQTTVIRRFPLSGGYPVRR